MSSSNGAILTFEEITYRYPGSETLALDHLNLELPAGKRIVLLGHNGSGKSTLILHANGILRPELGRVSYRGKALGYQRADLVALRQRVGVVFQNADDQLFSANVLQDISFGPLNLRLGEDETRTRALSAAEACGVTELLMRPTHSLSGGEKARVALAGVIAMQPEVLLVDEPTASLDPPARRQIFQIFERLHAEGATIVLSTHEMEIARYWADFVVVLAGGRTLSAADCATTFANAELLRSLGMDVPWYTSLAHSRAEDGRSKI